MGIPTLISTHTADDDASLDITSGIDSTYDEYMFVCTDLNPVTDGQYFNFQVNGAGESGYNESITSASWYVNHAEDDAQTNGPVYSTNIDQANGTAFQTMAAGIGNGADESAIAILHLFSPASTVYVKHFWLTSNLNTSTNYTGQMFFAGYINTTTAIDEISFKMTSGNFDGVIQMYGIA